MTTAADQEVLAQIAAAQAKGEDPFGDSDDSTVVAQEAVEEVNEVPAEEVPAEVPTDETTAVEAAADTPSQEALEAIANEGEPVLDNDPLQFNAQIPSDYKTVRAGLISEKSEAMAKMMAGEIDASEYAAIEARVLDSLEDLSAQRIRAETLIEANAQTAANAQQTLIQALIVRAKDEVPYATDTKAQRQFDMALQQVGADPDNTGKPFAHLVNEAHRVVMALRGTVSKPAAKSAEQLATEAVATAAARKPAGEAPVTLRGIPAAATSNTGGSITDQLARLSGQQYEAAFSKLTAAQRASMLDE